MKTQENLLALTRAILATWFLVTNLSLETNAQEFPSGGTLNGEHITSTVFNNDAFPSFVATSDHVYQFEDAWNPLTAYYSQEFQAPKGTKIVAMGKKTDRTGHFEGIVFLLDNGEVYFHDWGAYSPVWFRGYIGTEGSENWEKVTGEAIYALSSSYLRVNRADTLQTWSIDSAGLGSSHIWDFAIDTAQHVYAATTNGLFWQHPDSSVWHLVKSLTYNLNLYRVFVDRKNRILVGGNGSGLYLSTDNGTSWSVDTAGLGTAGVTLIADDAFYNLYVVAPDANTNSSRIYKSTGGTSSWQLIDADILQACVNPVSIQSLSGDSMLVAGTSFGVFASTDQGTSWFQNNNGIVTENYYGFLKSPQGVWFADDALGIFSKNPADTVWTKVYPTNGYQGNLPLAADGSGNLYTAPGATSGGGPLVWTSTDNGTSWNPDTAGSSILKTGVFIVDELGGQRLATSQYGNSYHTLIFSKQTSGTWTLDTAGFTSTNYSFTSSVSSDKHGYLYLSGSYFNVGTPINARVMRRPVGGGTWTPDTAGLPSTVHYFSAMGPDKDGNMLGISGSSLYRRVNNVWSLVPMNSNVSSYSPHRFSVDSTGALFVSFTNFAGDRGVYFTEDSGTTWTYAGLDSISVNQLVSYGDSTFACTNDGLYILQRQAAGTTGVKKVDMRPAAYALFQNYPNPFNPTTTIQFSIGKSSIVNLKIFDLLGREVATLVNGRMSPGEHQVSFDASKLASGVYFYRLEAGSFVATRKLVLLK